LAQKWLNRHGMYWNFTKIAFRHLLKNKVYTILNITGLAVGISSCILIFLYIQSELSYDRYWTDADRIYRVTQTLHTKDNSDPYAYTGYSVAPTLQADYPEIESTVRLISTGKEIIWYENEVYSESDIYICDETFFDVFDLKLKYGKLSEALASPTNIVISEDLATRIFGDINPIGKELKFTSDLLVVSGVISNPRFESHLCINALVPMSLIDDELWEYEEDWVKLLFFTYLKFKTVEQGEQFDKNISSFYKKHLVPWIRDNNLGIQLEFNLQPIRDIHFTTDYKFDIPSNTNKQYIYLFASIALFILLIACINYTNLATSRYAIRAKEVAIRKTVGSHRRNLVIQFLGESLIIALVAVILAFTITELCIPFFNGLTGKELEFFSSTVISKIMILSCCIVAFVGLVAGSYPAIYLSRFMPAEVLKGGSSKRLLLINRSFLVSAGWLRKVLVVFQFVISLTMIIGTFLIVQQTNFMKHQDLGFNDEHLVAVEIPEDSVLIINNKLIKKKLIKTDYVEDVAFTYTLPGIPGGFGRLIFIADREKKNQEGTMNFLLVDFDFLDMLDIELEKGRLFSRTYRSDTGSSFVINEAAAKYLGWKEPIGQRMLCTLADGKIIGVVKDFHYASLHNPIEPLVIMVSERYFRYMVFRVKPVNLKKTIKYVKSMWYKLAPNHPMEYFFVDERIERHYKNEENLRTIVGYFAIISILISLIGLIGLVSFNIEQRQKELGIRKVLGATPWGIVTLLSKEYTRLIAFSTLIAFPLSYYLISLWLKEFAYHIKIGVLPFILAISTILLLALVVVYIKAMNTARSNPADSIKYE
jgi:putative ABC transport system permease protein